MWVSIGQGRFCKHGIEWKDGRTLNTTNLGRARYLGLTFGVGGILQWNGRLVAQLRGNDDEIKNWISKQKLE